jgi:hypothetical protein
MLQFNFYHKYIEGTFFHDDVIIKRGILCKIKPSLTSIINKYKTCIDGSVFLNTKSLKHIYDRHIYDKCSLVDFEIVLNNLTQIIKYPDQIRKNTESKRGDFLFVKNIKGRIYFVSIEVIIEGNMEVVSASVTREKYLKKFTLLWSWGAANSPS